MAMIKRNHNYMKLVKGKNTSVEKIVYAYLRLEQIYFQKHYRTKFGIVLDVALPRKKKAVFIDGDFWHGKTIKKVRDRRGSDDFWTKKIDRNIERDEEQSHLLQNNNWTFIRVWESDINRKRTREECLEKIKNFLTS
jgi:DNA mismatch endonuclease (patch repair protein)